MLCHFFSHSSISNDVATALEINNLLWFLRLINPTSIKNYNPSAYETTQLRIKSSRSSDLYNHQDASCLHPPLDCPRHRGSLPKSKHQSSPLHPSPRPSTPFGLPIPLLLPTRQYSRQALRPTTQARRQRRRHEEQTSDLQLHHPSQRYGFGTSSSQRGTLHRAAVSRGML